MASVSASSAVGASAVAWMTPVQAGVPRAGSIRWCATPWRVRQRRVCRPLVATAPVVSVKVWAISSPKRVLDVDRARHGVDAADPDVAAGVDGVGGVAGERLGREVGGQALRAAAEIEPHARGQPDRASRAVHVDRAPAGGPARPGRAALRRVAERVGERRGDADRRATAT